MVWWVSWVEAAPLGRKIHYLCLYWPPLSCFCPLLPHRTQESLWPLHPQALHQVYLPHCIVPDLSVPAAACLPAYCHPRTRQARPTGPSTDHCRVDDTTMGAGWVSYRMITWRKSTDTETASALWTNFYDFTKTNFSDFDNRSSYHSNYASKSSGSLFWPILPHKIAQQLTNCMEIISDHHFSVLATDSQCCCQGENTTECQLSPTKNILHICHKVTF